MKKNFIAAGLVGLMVISGSVGVFADTSKKEVKAYEIGPASIEDGNFIESNVDGEAFELSESQFKKLLKEFDSFAKGDIFLNENDLKNLVDSGLIAETELKKLSEANQTNIFEGKEESDTIIIEDDVPLKLEQTSKLLKIKSVSGEKVETISSSKEKE